MSPALIGLIGKVAPAALNFAANIGSGMMNGNTQESINRQSLAHADEAAELAYRRQNDFWQRQIAYASPGNQMSLMAAAGINPNIAAGGSIGSIPSAPSVSQASTPSLGMYPMNFGSPLQDLLDIQRVRNETNQTDATVDNILADTNLKIENLDMVKASIKQIDANSLLLNQQQQYYSHLTDGEKFKALDAALDYEKRTYFLDEEYLKMNQEFDISRQEYITTLNLLTQRVIGVKLDNQLKRSQISLNAQELKRVQAFNAVADKLYQAQSDTAVAREISESFDADMKKKFGTADKYASYIEMLINAVLGAVKAAK